MDEFPKKVKACDVAGGIFAPELFKLENGRATYDQVWVNDGGQALYLVRVTATDEGLKVTKRWIDWDTEIVQLFDPE